MRGSRGGSGGSGPPPLPLEFAKLNIADITGNEKIRYLSYLCIGPPWKNFLNPRLLTFQTHAHMHVFAVSEDRNFSPHFLLQFLLRGLF